MWYHSLKTRQSVKRINTRNSSGTAVALEYIDKKVEVHHLSREASPLAFDEGTCVIFVDPQDGCLILIAVNISAKGKSTFEFRAWELTSGTAFVQRDITVKDVQGLCINDGKSKAILSLPEVSQHNTQHGLKADGLGDVISIALGVSMIYIWKCTKVDGSSINCDIVGQVNSSMSALDVLLLQSSKGDFPQLLVGESGGVRVWEEAEEIGESESTFKDTFISVLSFDAGTSLVTCQDFQRIHNGACIFTNNIGNLYLFMASQVTNLRLPVSQGGHGLFAVENVDENCSKVTLAVVAKGHTINLYQLEDLQNLSLKPGSGQDLSLVPNHVLFSTQSLGAIAFLNKASLIACSPSSRTLSMWVGV